MNVDRPHHVHAGLRSRVVAFALDYLLIGGYILVLATISTLLLRGPIRRFADPLFASPPRRDLVAFLTLILPVMLYFTYGESAHKHATWGKRKAGLFVTDKHGYGLTRRRSFARAALKFAPWQLAHTSLFHIPGWPMAVTTVPPLSQGGLTVAWFAVGAYVLSIMLDKQQRALYDRAVGTMVVKHGVGA